MQEDKQHNTIQHKNTEVLNRQGSALVLVLGVGLILLVSYGIVFLLTNYPIYLSEQNFIAENALLYNYFLNKSNWGIVVSNWTCGNTNITIEFLEPAFNGLFFNKSSGAVYDGKLTCMRNTK